MESDNIVLYFSIFVAVCVAIWAVHVIRTFNNIGKK